MSLRWGLVGGGGGAKIGPVHLAAARRSGAYDLVMAAPSSRADVAAATDWGCPTTADWHDLLTAGLDAVSLVTPNSLHMEMAKAFDAAGVAVICDKPLAALPAEVKGWTPARPFTVTYNYSAYPAIRAARKLVAEGALGTVRLVRIGWGQDGMLKPGGEAGWRGDLARSGPGGTLADLGTHGIHLAEFVLQAPVTELCAELETFGAATPRHAEMLWRFGNGARGSLWVSQHVPGGGKGLSLDIVGTERTLRWRLEAPDAVQMLAVGEAADVPPALPMDAWTDGFIGAFAALYTDAAAAVRGEPSLAPTYADGVRGMRFIAAALESRGGWVGL
jgi:predicted dehydrogenase